MGGQHGSGQAIAARARAREGGQWRTGREEEERATTHHPLLPAAAAATATGGERRGSSVEVARERGQKRNLFFSDSRERGELV